MPEPRCAFTLRAETGPCETCGHDGHSGAASGCASKGIVCDVVDLLCCDCDTEGHNAGMDHPYQPPRTGVCGHVEERHTRVFANSGEAIAWLEAPDDPDEVFFCEDCGSDHAWTTKEQADA